MRIENIQLIQSSDPNRFISDIVEQIESYQKDKEHSVEIQYSNSVGGGSVLYSAMFIVRK